MCIQGERRRQSNVIRSFRLAIGNAAQVRAFVLFLLLVGLGSSVSFAQTYTGCSGNQASGQLQLWIVSLDSNTGLVQINGVDTRQPINTPFTWTWGDGTTTQEWFPPIHTYSSVQQSYTLQVVSHEDDGTTDCSQLVIAFAQVVAFTQYAVPDGVGEGVSAGPDGNLWLTGSAIGRMNTNGMITGEFAIPHNSAPPAMITSGPDGNLWFTNYGNNGEVKISRITTAGNITEFSIPTAGVGGFPFGITAGPDGNLWFVESVLNKIGRITPSGVITEFSIPGKGQYYGGTEPWYITAGPDGNLWFTERDTEKIGRITPAGVITEFTVPNAILYAITAGPDGNLWFTDTYENAIRRITPTGVITEFQIPTRQSTPFDITTGPDGNLWFTEYSTNKLGRITPAGVITEFPISPGVGVGNPRTIIAGPDGNLWFVDGQTLVKANIPGGVQLTVAPNVGGNTGSVTVQLFGRLQTGATVKLSGPGPDIFGTNTTVTNALVLTATFDLTGALPGSRTVVVTNLDGGVVSLAGAFTIEEGGAPDMKISIVGRDIIRFGTTQPYYAYIENQGTVDASNVAAYLFQTTTAQPAQSGALSAAAALPSPPSTFFGNIAAHSFIVLPLTAIGPASGSLANCSSIQSSVHILQSNDPCATFKAAKAASEIYLNVLYGARLVNLLLLANSIEFKICFNPSDPSSSTACDALESIDSQFDSAIKSAESAEKGLCASAAAAGCPLNCNDPTDINALKVIGDGVRAYISQLKQIFLLPQIPLDQVQALDSQVALFETQALALPSALVFPTQQQPQPPVALPGDISSSIEVCGVSSFDPNSKTGAVGVGPGHYIAGDVAIPYFVSFENTPTATAPAQTVTVTDMLDPSFDLSTLVLGPITFPSQIVTPPAIPLLLAPFAATLDLRPVENLLVQVKASLNNSTGVLTWILQTLDPATGLPPTDPLSGFLPPGSDGGVVFSLSPKSTILSGTIVPNAATVFFDNNPAINTPTWSNTIDRTQPMSKVSSLPSTQSSTNIPVQWSGTDVGAGIQDFTIYVSDNWGTYTPWLVNVAAGQGVYSGVVGHTYDFYSIARDLVGNVESGKSVAEATTSIVTPPQLVVTRSLSRDQGTNDIVVVATVTNNGGSVASGVQLTIAKIGSTVIKTALPQSLGAIAAGSSAQVTVRFPGSAGSPGAATTITLGGIYTGASFSATARTSLP